MNMNKILLVLIIASGFLLIIYANSGIFNRHSVAMTLHKLTSEQDEPHHQQHHHHHHHHQHRAHDASEDGEHGPRGMRGNLTNVVAPVVAGGDGPVALPVNGQQQPAADDGPSALKRVQYVPKRNNATEYNIFIIYTKESQNVILRSKFELFLKSLLKYSTIELHLHVITDELSEGSAEELIKQQIDHYRKVAFYTLYDVRDCAEKVSDIVHGMLPLFNYRTGSYYSDALFMLSLGLHRIVDRSMRRAILIDCDVVFRSSVSELFEQFEHFSAEHLFGLAPELTPVYRHVLSKYRMSNPRTTFGAPYYQSRSPLAGALFARDANKPPKHGYPGLNSGVVMLQLDRIRESRLYAEIIKHDSVKSMVEKYSFKGHLGDQDFYTLMGFEFPGLIYRLDCVWNRQLCTWWREHGYGDIFDSYFHCEGKVKVYHGNCNTRIPE